MGYQRAPGRIVTSIRWWLIDRAARLLEPDEREVVRGDFAELGMSPSHALRDLLGLILRRHARLWLDWQPWVALATLALPIGILLSHVSRSWAVGNSIYLWLYANNWTWSFLTIPGARHDLFQYGFSIALDWFALLAWSWTSGLALGAFSRRTVWVNGLFLGCLVVGGTIGSTTTGQANPFNRVVFSSTFYGVVFPWFVRIALVLLPIFYGIRRSLRSRSLPLLFTVLCLILVIALTLAKAKGIESSFIFGRGIIPLDPGPDGLTGTADDPRPLRLLPLVMAWPAAYLVARSAWEQWGPEGQRRNRTASRQGVQG